MVTVREQDVKILDQLLGRDNETVFADWKLVGEPGTEQAVYEEYSRETDAVQKYENMFDNPHGRAFYAYRTMAIDAATFVRHPTLGWYVRAFGFSHVSSPQRKSALPTAGYMNSVLDDVAHNQERFRFYEPEDQGKSLGAEYITKLAVGLVPLDRPDGGWYSHDVIGHALGFPLIDSKTTEQIESQAQEFVDRGIDTNERGELEFGSPEANFADAVDALSASLTEPLRLDATLTRRQVHSPTSRLAVRDIEKVASMYERKAFRGWRMATRIVKSLTELSF